MLQNPIMSAQQPQSGVCIIRVEVQPEHCLITVTMNRNTGRNIYPARPGPEQHFAEPSEALQAVADFLESFVQAPRA
jgi:hypothetical protein